MEYKNIYSISLSDEVMLNYYNHLINCVFKILPIVEGLDIKTKRVIFSSNVAYEQYQKYVQGLVVQITGNCEIFCDNIYYLKLLCILQGMLTIEKDNHGLIKSSVFSCIDICNKMKGAILNDS